MATIGPAECRADDRQGIAETGADDGRLVVITINQAGTAHNADTDGNGVVDVDDLVNVITAWGSC